MGQSQAGDGALFGVHLLVNKGGGAAEGGSGQHIHDAADGAGVADGKHLDDRQHHRDGGGGQRAEEEAADGDGSGLYVQLEEGVYLRQHLAQEHQYVGHGGEHAQRGDGLDVHAGAGTGDDGDIGFGHKNTLL